ncbi:MAG: hypothetical protein PHV37_09835 [Candidatus Gastranaerophilales bacterium]|nr:hypothetical protein [Candidatus Gastranaerophilales bacterium]
MFKDFLEIIIQEKVKLIFSAIISAFALPFIISKYYYLSIIDISLIYIGTLFCLFILLAVGNILSYYKEKFANDSFSKILKDYFALLIATLTTALIYIFNDYIPTDLNPRLFFALVAQMFLAIWVLTVLLHSLFSIIKPFKFKMNCNKKIADYYDEQITPTTDEQELAELKNKLGLVEED